MAAADEIVLLRIELQGIEPLIWRRVAVNAGMSLTGLHSIIQAAMGWLDRHLWNFEAGGRKFGMHLPDDPDWNGRLENANAIILATLLHSGERQMQYVYDMGDFWEHSIIFEKVTGPSPEVIYPQFLGGERRCPPEDCGGPFGYGEFLHKISSRQRRIREGALEWYGGPYDPDDIGERRIIAHLGRIANGRSKG